MHGELFKGNTPWTEEEWPTSESLVIKDFDYDESLGFIIHLLGKGKKVHYNIFFIKEKSLENYVKNKVSNFVIDEDTKFNNGEDTIYFTNLINEEDL